MSDPRLVRLVEKGVLEFVLWESTIECGKGARLKCWQPVLYSHAILAAWGTGPNLYYSFADHDEYLAIPYPDSIGNVQAIITMCSAGQTQARARGLCYTLCVLQRNSDSTKNYVEGSARQTHALNRPLFAGLYSYTYDNFGGCVVGSACD